MQKEISNVSEIMNYVESSRDSYDCKISNGLAVKKRGDVKFKETEQDKVVKVVVRKLSGNGEFSIGDQVFTATQSDTEYDLTGTLERPASAVGAVSIVKLIVESADVENVGSTIELIVGSDSESVLNVESVGSFEAVDDEFKGSQVVDLEQAKEPVFENTVAEHKCVVEVKEELLPETVRTIEPTASFVPVCYYSGKTSKFNTLIRKTGNYTLLTAKNDKIALVMANSELHMPVSIGPVNYVKITFTAKSISRNTAPVQVGLRGERIELAEVSVSNKESTYSAILKIDSTFSRSQIVFVTSKVDSINLYDLTLTSCTEADFDTYQIKVSEELFKRFSSATSARDKISSPKFFFVIQ